jgi:hypothetical protein
VAQQQVREVPPHQAEKFVKDMGGDPKFQRFQRRLELSFGITESRKDRSRLLVVLALLKVRVKRLLTAMGINKTVLIVFTVAEVAFRVWYALGASVVLAIAVGVALWLQLKRTREAVRAKQAELAEVDEEIESACAEIFQIDEQASRGIKIIDPATFGAPAKQEKVEA